MMVKKGPAFWNLDYHMPQDSQIQLITACIYLAEGD